MNYKHQVYDFYGLKLDTYVTPDGRCWVTLTSLAKGVGVHQQTTQNWLKRKDAPMYEKLEVRVGPKLNTRAWAYPAEVAVAYLKHLLSVGKPGVIEVISNGLLKA